MSAMMLNAALRYVDRGLAVVPLHTPNGDGDCDCGRVGCPGPGKHPRITDWTRGSTNREQVETWWAMWPAANVGIATGPPSQLLVLDVDPRAGGDEALHALEQEHGALPATAEVLTGAGRHIYFRCAKAVASVDLAPGLEIKSSGRQVVAPPSLHPTGKRYEWEASSYGLAAPPEWLLSPERRRNGSAAPVGDEIPAGERNSTLVSIGGTMRRRGLGEAEILAALQVTNSERCRPPLPQQEIEKIASSVARYEPDTRKATPLVSGDPGEAAAETASTLTDFTRIEARPVRWAWRDRIALGKLTALSGRPKVGKGLLYTELIAQATRGELEGDLQEPRAVFIVTTEDDPGDVLKPRLMAAGADLSRVSYFQMGTKDEPVPFRVPEHAEELGRRIAEKQAALVVIDPLVEFVDGKLDSHKSQAVRQAMASLNRIAREHGCAVLVVIHLNKGASTDPLLRQEASAAFTQVVRGGLLLGHDPEDPEGDAGDQRVLAVSASNLAPLARSLVYRIETRRVIGDTSEEIATAGIVYIGESSADGHDLLRGQDIEERSGTDEAVEFLKGELAGGAQPAGEVQAKARKMGITDKVLRSGRERLGIHPCKDGFKGPWMWGLPEDALPPRAPSEESGRGHLGETPLPKRDSSPSEVAEDAQGALSVTRASSGIISEEVWDHRSHGPRRLPPAAEIEAKAEELGLEPDDEGVTGG